jgi:hypothetical protein
VPHSVVQSSKMPKPPPGICSLLSMCVVQGQEEVYRGIYRKIKLISTQITPRIRGLHSQRLAYYACACERKRVACTAPGRLAASCDHCGGETVRQGAGNGSERFGGAHVCSSIIAIRDGVVVCERGVVDGAVVELVFCL